jgi:hypothetical protein
MEVRAPLGASTPGTACRKRQLLPAGFTLG